MRGLPLLFLLLLLLVLVLRLGLSFVLLLLLLPGECSLVPGARPILFGELW